MAGGSPQRCGRNPKLRLELASDCRWRTWQGFTSQPYLDPKKSRGPKLLKVAQKATVLHNVGVQVREGRREIKRERSKTTRRKAIITIISHNTSIAGGGGGSGCVVVIVVVEVVAVVAVVVVV